MFDISKFPIADAVRKAAQLSPDDYQRLYQQSVENPDAFWGEQAKAFLDWSKPWQQVQQSDLKTGQASWFKGAELNVSYNCIDRHLESRGEQIAIVWEGDSLPNQLKSPTKNCTTTWPVWPTYSRAAACKKVIGCASICR